MNTNYRIVTAGNKIKFAGTDKPSWMDLETAKKLVDYAKGEKVYQYGSEGRPMWEVC